MAKIRVIFFGTPDFAVPTLSALAGDDGFAVEGVITNPDRPAGRGMELYPPPVKNAGKRLDIPVFQTDTLKRDRFEQLAGDALDADVGVVVACGFFIPKWLREAFPMGAVNLHPSLLPELRGAAPVNRAIIRGYENTGMTVFRLVKEMDAGPILAQEEIVIGADETAGQLLERLSESGARLMLNTIKSLAAGEISPREQDENGVTYAPKLKRGDCGIDWSMSARDVYNLYRGLSPRPGAYFECESEKVKVTEMALVRDDDTLDSHDPGVIIDTFDDSLRIACGDGAVDLAVIRPPGKGDMSGTAFARGRGIGAGYKIGWSR
ncbi:MAG: methionyl-tRNA formyltransferase [bacterium]|nr:methionyl-tRNA formyltransferase [bacterium]